MNNKETKEQQVAWSVSPITKRKMVMTEYDDKNGESKMDMSSGFFTNDYPLNYKKNPEFDINEYEKNMPNIIRELRFDDGKSYWYPTTIRTSKEMLFPVGTKDDWRWCYAKVKNLTEDEKEIFSKDKNFESKLDMENAEYTPNNAFVLAIRKISGYSLGDL